MTADDFKDTPDRPYSFTEQENRDLCITFVEWLKLKSFEVEQMEARKIAEMFVREQREDKQHAR